MAFIALADTEVADLYVSFEGGSKTLVKVKRGQTIPTEFLNETDVKKSLAFGALGRLIRGGWVKEVADEEIDMAKKTVSFNRLPSEVDKPSLPSNTPLPASNPASEKSKYNLVESISAAELHQLRQDKGMVQNLDLTQGNGKSVNVEAMVFEQSVMTNGSGGLSVVQAEIKKDIGNDAVYNEKTGKMESVGTGTEKSGPVIENYEPKTDISAVKDYIAFEQLNHFDQLLCVKGLEDKNLLTEIRDKSPKKQIQNVSMKRMSELP